MVGSIALGVVATVLATWVATVLLRRGAVMDHPNQRSSHLVPVPRGGGVALVVGCAVVVAVVPSALDGTQLGVLFAATVAAGAIGLADDLRGGVSVGVRLLGLTVICAGGSAAMLSGHELSEWVVPCVLIATAWAVTYTNFFNFMDGINGIAAGQAIVAGVALGLVGEHLHQHVLATAAFGLAAAAVGFLPWNYPRARVFMGDVGTYFAGAWLSLLLIAAIADGATVEAALGPVAVFATDAGVTVIRHLLDGKPVTAPHRDHVYQRLVGAGWSHTLTAGLVTALTAVTAALGSVSLARDTAARCAADLAIVALLFGYLTLPRLVPANRTRAQLGHGGIT